MINDQSMDRRELVKVTAAGAVSLTLAACGTQNTKVLEPSNSSSPSSKPNEVVLDPNSIPAGTGVLVDSSAGKLLVFQTQSNEWHAMTAECPHLKCYVRFYETQEVKCKCHGSRFDLKGGVLEGPAKEPLKEFPVIIEPTTVRIQVGNAT